jgi:hypothetical protein
MQTTRRTGLVLAWLALGIATGCRQTASTATDGPEPVVVSVQVARVETLRDVASAPAT